MTDRLLLGLGRRMIPVPCLIWHQLLTARARKVSKGLGFMSTDHHRVRDFVVMELPRVRTPLSEETISEALGLPAPRVHTILDELEAHLTFLFRNDRGEVSWAYPVTVDETPHFASFDTGEEAYSP